ncbi:hypothetical protein [Celeribacter neptunius]|uniref:Muramidase (Phage lambda lysozyme) n=1 Tax=Celeribacter neptunius TaxID=588602 RepID=A0A1I3WZY2_9RHOB|nr:hypothetical protein [Celeribacter neptunius]SFK12659.1 hypothetical protein SAMN04487991_3907 [Celeribacter neptunius]
MLRKNCVLPILIALWPVASAAEPVSLLRPSGQGWDLQRQPLIVNLPQPLITEPFAASSGSAGFGPSLFAGRAEGSFFEPLAARPEARAKIRALAVTPDDIAMIRAVIGKAESLAAGGYDAVQHGARIRPGKKASQMSLGEIFKWIEDTPGQPHAIGYYQFIPSTLARLVTELDLGPEMIFTPAVQDRLADILLADAGIFELRAGEMTRHQFMNNLAKIWAGLPTSTGKSHYHGYAGNKATMSWAEFDRALATVFPS